MISPVHFTPYLKPVIWGGTQILTFKGLSSDMTNIGESWDVSSVPGHVSVVAEGPYAGMTLTELIAKFGGELVGEENFRKYGTTFPLLIKLIDATDDLSVQVHPNDALARERHNSSGKTEMWNVISARPGAKIFAGLSRRITPEEFEQHVADNSIMDVVATYESCPGDVYFLPAGQIHAIGAGNLLVEIQQTSDITYRIYDYGRTDKEGNRRELHTTPARMAIDYDAPQSCRREVNGSLLIDCPYFVVHRLSEGEIPHTRDSFTAVMSISGTALVDYDGGTVEITQGNTYLFPATMKKLRLRGDATILSIQS